MLLLNNIRSLNLNVLNWKCPDCNFGFGKTIDSPNYFAHWQIEISSSILQNKPHLRELFLFGKQSGKLLCKTQHILFKNRRIHKSTEW